jgi:N-carbamoyl-L-amino-acid hydrolase
MVDILEASAKRLGIPYKRMISGAFHDALHLSRVAPTAMIFVPCRDGLSHNEAEYVEPEHAVIGARLLLEATLAATRGLDALS